MFKFFTFKGKKEKISKIANDLLAELIQRINKGEEVEFNNGDVKIKRVNGVFKIEKNADIEQVLEMLETYTEERAYHTKEYHDFLVNQKLNKGSQEPSFDVLYQESSNIQEAHNG